MQIGDVVTFTNTRIKSRINDPKQFGIVVSSRESLGQTRFKVYFPHFGEYDYSGLAVDYKVISNANR